MMKKTEEASAIEFGEERQTRSIAINYADRPETSYIRHFDSKVITSVEVSQSFKRFLMFEKFAEDAKKYIGTSVDSAAYIEYSSYYPMFDNMSKQQIDYYLFWRTLARSGNIIKTDLAYYCVYIYELINNIGESLPEQNIKELIALWEFMSSGSKNKLTESMTAWLIDYIILNPCGILPCELERRIPGTILDAEWKEPLLEAYIDGSELSFEMLSEYFTDYDKADETVVREVWKYVNNSLYDEFGMTLFEMARPADKIIKRDAYPGAVVSDLSSKKLLKIKYTPYLESVTLRNAVTAIFKETENQLRVKNKKRGNITIAKNFAIDIPASGRKIRIGSENLCDIVRQHFNAKDNVSQEPENVRTVININRERVAEIENRSWEIVGKFALLEDTPETGHKITDETEHEIEHEIEGAIYSDADIGVIDNDRGTDNGYTPEMLEFMSCLYYNKPIAVLMPELIADEINNRSIDDYGDILVDIRDMTLNEDMLEEIKSLIGV